MTMSRYAASEMSKLRASLDIPDPPDNQAVNMQRQHSSDSTISASSQQNGLFTPAQRHTTSGPSSSPQSQASLAVSGGTKQKQQLDPMTDLSYFDKVTLYQTPQMAYEQIKKKDPRRAHVTDSYAGVIRVRFAPHKTRKPDGGFIHYGCATHPEKALAMKLLHAAHHNSFDHFSADDVSCFTRTFLQILLVIKGGRKRMNDRDQHQHNTLCRDTMNNIQRQLLQAFKLHDARVKQHFVLPAAYMNASEAQKKQYYESRCKSYMLLCNVNIVRLQVVEIKLLVGLMKATGLVEDMDLQWYAEKPCQCKPMNDWRNAVINKEQQRMAEGNAGKEEA